MSEDKYSLSLHGQAVEGGGNNLHEALMDLQKKGYKTVKGAMDAGYQLDRDAEYKKAEEARHKDGGSHDSYHHR